MLVVDDHSLIIEGICRLVEKLPEVVVADAVTSGEEAVTLIARRDYDLYVLDVGMPGMSGFELIVRIREINENARIIINTMHEEIWMVNRLVQSGVNAVILKSSTASYLIDAVRCVLQGNSYACPRFASISRKLCRTSPELQQKDVPTRREQEVLQAVAKGLNTREIADLLKVSENTVETFRRRLIFKFDAKNAIDMVLKAVSQGWIIVE